MSEVWAGLHVPSHRVWVIQDCHSCCHTTICMLDGFGSKQMSHVLVHHKCLSLPIEMGARDTQLSPGLSSQTQDLPRSQLDSTAWITDYTQESASIVESGLGLHPSSEIISSVSWSKLLRLSIYQFPQFKIGITPLTLQDGHKE